MLKPILLSYHYLILFLNRYILRKTHKTPANNWVTQADLQQTDGCRPNHVMVDEIVIKLNDKQYCLYAAVDTKINKSLYT